MMVVSLASTLRAAEPNASYEPEFIAVVSHEPLTMTSIKWTQPIYNLVGWKRSDGTIVRDIFEAGEVIRLTNPNVERRGEVTHWKVRTRCDRPGCPAFTWKVALQDYNQEARDVVGGFRRSAHCPDNRGNRVVSTSRVEWPSLAHRKFPHPG